MCGMIATPGPSSHVFYAYAADIAKSARLTTFGPPQFRPQAQQLQVAMTLMSTAGGIGRCQAGVQAC